jgi:hypothetical protein
MPPASNTGKMASGGEPIALRAEFLSKAPVVSLRETTGYGL